ncbi:hypothetical protein [Methylobacterium sp. A54F]
MTTLPSTGIADAGFPSRAMAEPDRHPCGGAQVLDLAICMILAVTIVGLLVLAL